MERNLNGVGEKNMEEKQVEKEVQLRVFMQFDIFLLFLFYGKCKMFLFRGEDIWMYYRWRVIEIMLGLGKLLEGGLERGSYVLRGGYRGKSQEFKKFVQDFLELDRWVMFLMLRVLRMYFLKNINIKNDKFVFFENMEEKGFILFCFIF